LIATVWAMVTVLLMCIAANCQGKKRLCVPIYQVSVFVLTF